MKIETYSDIMKYCRSNRESDGFCRLSSACSGPCYSNLASDYPVADGKEVFRGKCDRAFIVRKED